MEIRRIPLDVRLQAARDGLVGQPEYLPALVRLWGGTRLKAFFGSCTQERDLLYEILDLAPEDDPTYQAAAGMIFDLRCTTFGNAGEEAAVLLAAPVRDKWEKHRKRREANG